MQLLYFWFTYTLPDTIRESGGNFSPEYDFFLEKKNDERYYLSNNKEWDGHKSIFAGDNSCIDNISAIVGTNGAGKTTILNMLLDMQIHSQIQGENENSFLHNIYVKYVLIFKGGCSLHIYTSIFDLVYTDICDEKVEMHVCTDKSNEYIPFNTHTLIYLSNSSFLYDKDRPMYSFDDRGVSSLILTPSKIEMVAHDYYHRMYYWHERNKEKRPNLLNAAINNIMLMHDRVQNFQQLIDITYYYKLWKRKDIHLNKTATELEVWFEPITKILSNYIIGSRYIPDIPMFTHILIPVYEGITAIYNENFLPEEKVQIRILFFNLVCEFLWDYVQCDTENKKEWFDSAKKAVQILSNNNKTLDSTWPFPVRLDTENERILLNP